MFRILMLPGVTPQAYSQFQQAWDWYPLLPGEGKLEEAFDYSQQVLDHRLACEGLDTWLTNRERIDLARMLHILGNNSEALDQLNEFKANMARIDEPDDYDRRLISEAEELFGLIAGSQLE